MTKFYYNQFYLIYFLITLVISIFSKTCPCGKRNIKNQTTQRIVGGNLSKQNAYPWTTALAYVGSKRVEQFCGASIIDNSYVLTAAHCVSRLLNKNEKLSNYKVLMGDIKLNGSNIVQYQIKEIKIHPNYNSKTMDNDIALIKLSSTIKFALNIQPICLHESTGQELTTQTTAVVVGWGAVRDGGRTVNSQREVQVQIVPVSNCKKNYKRVKIAVSLQNMICAASDQKDSCSGDSGGPLFIKRKKSETFEQIGIVSFGRGCAQKGYPGVYTKVSTFKNFIAQNTKDGQKC